MNVYIARGFFEYEDGTIKELLKVCSSRKKALEYYERFVSQIQRYLKGRNIINRLDGRDYLHLADEDGGHYTIYVRRKKVED